MIRDEALRGTGRNWTVASFLLTWQTGRRFLRQRGWRPAPFYLERREPQLPPQPRVNPTQAEASRRSCAERERDLPRPARGLAWRLRHLHLPGMQDHRCGRRRGRGDERSGHLRADCVLPRSWRSARCARGDAWPGVASCPLDHCDAFVGIPIDPKYSDPDVADIIAGVRKVYPAIVNA